MASGLSFGGTSATPGGLSFGAGATTTTTQSGTGGLGGSTGFSLGTGLGASTGFTAAAAAKPAATAAFGQAAPAAAGTGFNFTGPATSTTTGFGSLGAAASTVPAATAGFQLGGVKTTTAGLTLATPAAPAAALGGFGNTAAVKPTGLTLGSTPAASATAPTLGASVGFNLGGTATTKPGLTLGAVSTAATSSGFMIGGLGGQTATTSSTAGGQFGGFTSTTAVTATNRGLGGVDPKTSQTGTGASSVNGKPSDNKAVKETSVPNEVCQTVEEFKKYVKQQKMTRENIARMSSKPMLKVQEEVASLQQLLSLVSNGLQRNSHVIDKLKTETAQELKHAEIAQRTKDTPPGLQYENTAPAEYFQRLAEDFEVRMVIYRQQIEEMESHLASLDQASMFTPQELSLLLSKLHESFISLAAQLQNVHEAVKVQKEHYLNYRKVFHGDTSNIFEKRRKVEEKTGSSVVTTTVGPTPFTGMSNAAAVAMATALNRTQQPAAPTLALGQTALGQTALGQTALGGGLLGGSQTTSLAKPSLFGATTTTASGFGSGFGNSFGSTATATGQSGFNFGTPAPTQTAAVKPLGSSFATGNTAASGSSFGASSFGSATTTPQIAGAFGSTPSAFGTPNAAAGAASGFGDSSFTLQKPPAGNKRGKR